MGLLGDIFGSGNDEDHLTSNEKRKKALRGGFGPTDWSTVNGARIIDWEAEVVIYQIFKADSKQVFDGGAGFGAGGLAAVPLDQTDIDPEDYTDPRGMTWEEIESTETTT